MTKAESILWEHLKKKQILSLRFRPQHPIYKFIADFYCHPIKLVIEVDGGIHHSTDQKEYDIGRNNELSNLNILVIRFTNEEVESNIKKVVNTIIKTCTERLPTLSQDPPNE